METRAHSARSVLSHRSHSAPDAEDARTLVKATEKDQESQRDRNRAALRLLREWLSDESGYDEENWPQLKEALEANRSSKSRRLFHD